jgi:hypothetical protein
MSNVVVTLFVVALLLVAVMTWSQASFGSLDSGAQSWKEMADTATEVARTDIEVTDAREQGAFVDVCVRNCGEIHLAEFADWDVIAHNYDGTGAYHISRLTYTGNSAPADGQWTVAGIYTDDTLAQEEVFEPGILDPGEVMLIRLRLSPGAGSGTTNWVIVSTYNGVVASAQFAG